MPDTVKVGCRHANGLRLRVSDWVENPADPSGGKLLREKAVLDLAGIAGQDVPFGRELRGYGVSEVDSDLFGTWMRLNEGDDLVQSGTIFRYDGSDEEKADTKAADQAKDVIAARETLADAERDLAERRADEDAPEAPAEAEPAKTEPVQPPPAAKVTPSPIPGPKPGETA